MSTMGTFVAILTVCLLGLTDAAWSQGERALPPTTSAPPSDAILMRTSTLFGYQVKSPQGEDLGKLEDIMIDMEAKRIAYGILSFGGFLGLGDKWVPVPWDALSFRPEERVLVLAVEKDKLQKAPNFERATLPELADRQWGAVIHTYYGYPPYWEKGQ